MPTTLDDLRHAYDVFTAPQRDIIDGLFELAERLHKLEGASKTPPAESPPEPFRITGPGKYRQRDGGVATVEERTNDPSFPWFGKDGVGWRCVWRENGAWLSYKQSPGDLMARIDEPATAQTKGWMNVHRSYGRNSPQSSLQGGVVYLTREEADAAPGAKSRVDCIEVSVAVQSAVQWKVLHDPWPDQGFDELPF